jgi:tetraacyldisaccharide 4'-kinase
LPAGPLRESTSGLARADLVLVTRKVASAAQADETSELARAAGAPRVAQLCLGFEDLRRVSAGAEERRPLEVLSGARVLAIAGVGNPAAFVNALTRAGALVDPVMYADHFDFTAREVSALVARARAHALVVCTLKDAVKLRGLWPRTGPALWYVSQRVELAPNGDLLMQALDQLVPSRHANTR